MKILCLLLACSLPALAETRLQQLLQEQRKEYPAAVITSGFFDARGVSRYRSRPGLHAGYDIAMPAGSAARAAWPGRVRALIPWAEGEWGVEVVHADGTTATYGHVVPTVAPGMDLAVGQMVGRIARDHLDVKMRDELGQLFDYARGFDWSLTIPAKPKLPSPQAVAWQMRWRRHQADPADPERARRLKLLRQHGLSLQTPKAGPAEQDLIQAWKRLPAADRKLLQWTEADQKAAAGWAERERLDQKKWELGLLAKNQWLRTRRVAGFWKDVLKKES